MLKPGRIEALQPHRQGVGLQRMQARLKYLSKFVKIFFSLFSTCFLTALFLFSTKKKTGLSGIERLSWKVSLNSTTKTFFVSVKKVRMPRLEKHPVSYILWDIFMQNYQSFVFWHCGQYHHGVESNTYICLLWNLPPFLWIILFIKHLHCML